MIKIFLALFSLSTLLVNAASSDDRRAISEMPITTNVLESAYFPLIQPYPGRTTNDNFRATVSTLFHGRFGETVTNLFVTNLTVINLTVVSNFFNTTTNITAYEITVTNNISHDRIFISTNITINGFDINTWTNDNQIFHPTINRGAGPLDYSFLVASNIVRVEDGRMSGTETWVSKSVALNIGDNQLPVAGNSQWNLIGPTSNPDDTTISLMNGITDAQKLVIYNITNAVPANGAFKLTNGTPIPDSLSGGIARLMGGRDWVATNGSWIMLEFHSPDWVEMDDRNVFTGAGGADTWHVVGGILQPVDLTLPVEIDSPLFWGPGTTNALYRTNNYALVLQASDVANRSQLWFTDAAGDTPVEVGMVGTGTALLQGSLEVQLQAGANGIVMDANHARPVNTLPFSLGDQELPFTNIWGGVLYVEGYQLTGTITNTINYSRGAIYHEGTNGAFVIASQSDGIAGPPRPIVLTNASVNFGNAQQLGYPPFSQAPLGTFTNIVATNLAATTTDIFTVPSGKRLMIWENLLVTTNATSTTVYFAVKTNAVYYRLAASSLSVTTNVIGSVPGSVILEEGEVLAVNSTQIGVNVVSSGILFDNSSPLSSKRFVAFGATTNVVLSVSAGKTFYPYTTSGLNVNTQLNYVNSSGAPATIAIYLVPDGETIGDGTLIKTTTVADTAGFGLLLPPLAAGTQVIAQSSSATAGQMIWFAGAEF